MVYTLINFSLSLLHYILFHTWINWTFIYFRSDKHHSTVCSNLYKKLFSFLCVFKSHSDEKHTVELKACVSLCQSYISAEIKVWMWSDNLIQNTQWKEKFSGSASLFIYLFTCRNLNLETDVLSFYQATNYKF